ncbi:uncharacterized protein Z520_02525 [Fonsecaea multimorphosa CBS 102226]|uniref:Uncharacterized protein n=1 Tax=Fonsecaea multimorphosa CBS 102226 TaxID=1442371 RepID=A0A0D2IZB8_9EURO|nr:uncharacterized protein Z520_02525 [Fonsecaea multimorphosa CBS 102226]KIY02387.1 hypothetical protein Z520_02525 [Fonsecaea multimorphosa CBS 102226]OAL29029.1 hypothetical protein AYO22_02465 [Fonsecaea multimorphosa]
MRELLVPSQGYRTLQEHPPEDDKDMMSDLEQTSLMKSDSIEDIEDTKASLRSSPAFRRLLLFAGMLALIACTAIVFASVVPFNGIVSKRKWDLPPPETHVTGVSKFNDRPHPCGNSSAEARALGCRFNQLTWAWLPPNCPMYANDQFVQAEKWVYWEDLDQTKPVDDDVWEEVLDGDRKIFAELREHATHCVYLFLSLSQVIRDGTPYYDKMVEYRHHEHCANMLTGLLRKLPEWHELNTLAGTVSFDQYCP